MSLTASSLRADVYNILDRVLETGRPAEIERNGKRLQIVAVDPVDPFENLPKRNTIVGDPDELIHMDWYSEWDPDPA